MLPPYDTYLASVVTAMQGVQCEIGGGPSRPDRGIEAVIVAIREMASNDRVCWLVGNGGSGTTADHIACDMVLQGWRAFALTNPALTTTMGNDFGWGEMYQKQLMSLARAGDVLIAMSCSGRSGNIVATLVPDLPPMFRVGLSGFSADNEMRGPGACDVSFYVPSHKYGEVQIAHLAILHAVIDMTGWRKPGGGL